jgi:hypothetical protein
MTLNSMRSGPLSRDQGAGKADHFAWNMMTTAAVRLQLVKTCDNFKVFSVGRQNTDPDGGLDGRNLGTKPD